MARVVTAVDKTLLRRRLGAAIDAAEDRWMTEPIVWRLLDCCTGPADILHAVLGVDPMARFRNRYTTPRGYLRVLRHDGFATLDAALAHVAQELGWRPIAPADAEPGDIGVGPHPQGRTCLIHKGGPFWIGPRGRGIGVVTSEKIELAFGVLG